MKKYIQQRFVGERALFQEKDAEISYCTFADGESPLKESSNLKIDNTSFQWKYPLWYSHDIEVNDCTWLEMARAGIWYTDDFVMHNVTMQAPKNFRRCHRIEISEVTIPNAEETLWNCDSIKIHNVTANGHYFGMNSQNIDIDGFTLTGNYPFDGAKNVHVRNAKMISKDAFWNAENVVIEDSYIIGEYFGWNAKNIKLINCTVESLQGFCYIENLKLENCHLLNTNLAFEYCTVEADIIGHVDSVKNPSGGIITADSIGEIIHDDEMKAPEEATRIIQRNK
ncbi:MAG: DUF3737 family protein [Veillonellaceae bacterium]|nr:DUF3737 family protein [Veillonellaceae bacterium]MDD6924251.1 DUF3737 family protein [Veillonellaceae bacterium]